MTALAFGLAVALGISPAWARSKSSPPIPGVPSEVTATATSPSSVHLSWRDNTVGESGFRIERSTDGARYTLAGETAADIVEFDDTGIADNTRYYYRVSAFDGSGATQASAPASATTPIGFWSIAGRVVEGNDFYPVVGATVRVHRGVSMQTPEYAPAAPIPDNSPNGVNEGFEITENMLIDQLALKLKITHSYPSDVIVRLIHPDGTAVLVHNYGGAVGGGGINTTYPTLTAPAQSFTAFSGKSTAGQWRLEVADTVSGDRGTLDLFQLSITGPAASESTTTDAQGYYTFANLASGKIGLLVEAPGLNFYPRELELRQNATRVNFMSDQH